MTIAVTRTKVSEELSVYTWANLVLADATGAVLNRQVASFADRSVQITGTFDGATVIFEGSNDGTNFRTLTDPQGNDISKTAAALEQITELVLNVRPRVTGAGALTDITVILLARKFR